MIQLLRQFGATETNESDMAMSWMNEPTAQPIECPGWRPMQTSPSWLASTGADADKLFADLMIAHHQGGIHMAQFAARPRQRDRSQVLAKSMITGQTGEISELRGLIGQ